jgi:phospholipid-binding lipoprotein MlaA
MKTKTSYSLVVLCFVFACAAVSSRADVEPANKSKTRATSANPAGKSGVSEELLKEYGETEDTSETSLVSDPLRPWNVAWFHFNDKFYFWLVKPVSTGYRYILYPRFVRVGIKNVLDNLAFPGRFLNCALQGRPNPTGTELLRFLTNSTLGVAGVWDPATIWFHMARYDEDFDQTLGAWGLPTGVYLNWPVVGPSSVRGTFGLLGDWVLNPIVNTSYGTALSTINTTSLGLNEYETLLKAALDPYVSIRDAYFENRAKEIAE